MVLWSRRSQSLGQKLPPNRRQNKMLFVVANALSLPPVGEQFTSHKHSKTPHHVPETSYWFRFVSRALCFAKVSGSVAADPTRGCPAPERAALCPFRFWQTPSGWSSGAAYRGHAFARITGAALADLHFSPYPPQIDT